MFVRAHGMHVFGASQQHNTQNTVTSYKKHNGSVTQLQFLGTFVEGRKKRREATPKRQIKGILKNAISMPNLAQNYSEDHPKIDHRQLKNVIKRQKRISKDPGVERERTKKTVKFNDPVSRLGDLESKYKLCSTDADDTGLRKNKQIQQISLRNAQGENKTDCSNLLITVVYDLKLKENKLITSNDNETTKNASAINKQKQEVANACDNSDNGHQRLIKEQTREIENNLDKDNGAHARNGETFLSHTVMAPVCHSVEKAKIVDGNKQSQEKTTTSEKLTNKQIKQKENVVVTRSRAKPVMFTRCSDNSVQTTEEPKRGTTNFCDEEKTSDIMRWLNDVKYEQERDGFCTLLISNGEIKY